MSTEKKWQELNREVVFQKYGKTVEKRDYLLPNGRTGDYYIVIWKPGACVLALTPDNRVVTVREYRPGPDRVLRELPGGFMEVGEDPRRAAARELLEETGYAGELEDWVGTWQVDAYTESATAIVIAKNCRKVQEPELDAREFGVVELANVSSFVAQARSGQLTDAAGAMLALDHLHLL